MIFLGVVAGSLSRGCGIEAERSFVGSLVGIISFRGHRSEECSDMGLQTRSVSRVPQADTEEQQEQKRANQQQQALDVSNEHFVACGPGNGEQWDLIERSWEHLRFTGRPQDSGCGRKEVACEVEVEVKIRVGKLGSPQEPLLSEELGISSFQNTRSTWNFRLRNFLQDQTIE